MARRLRSDEGEGEREAMKGWEEGGEDAKAESSVRSRLVGVRAEEVVDVVDIFCRLSG